MENRCRWTRKKQQGSSCNNSGGGDSALEQLSQQGCKNQWHLLDLKAKCSAFADGGVTEELRLILRIWLM